MEFIKKIIKEELKKVLSALNETDFFDKSSTSLSHTKSIGSSDDKNSIIYNYEKGRAFAGDNLEVDIANLNRYHLVEYLPKNINEEMWSFEFYTVYGTILIVDIHRTIRGGKSFWDFKFGQLYKEEKTPTIIDELEGIEGYENFISTVNEKISTKIDPSRY